MSLLDMLLPPRCAACHSPRAWPLCPACSSQIGVITPPWCERCGRPWSERLRECVDCPSSVVDRSRSPFLYEGPIARAIKSMKFLGTHALASHFAAGMTEVCDVGDAHMVTWVPLSRRRRARRGFDQAELLARCLADRLDLPVTRLLLRGRSSSSQARKTGAERRAALGGAFRPIGSVPERVLLVDDVLTTGTTAAACAEALKAGGARHVTVVTAARSLGGSIPARCRAVALPEGARVP